MMGQYWYERLASLLMKCGKRVRPDKRIIYVGGKDADFTGEADTEEYPDNRVESSKYTIYSFLPKNLFEQFHRIANFYFLCVAFISVIIDGPVSPWTSILPLFFVISVTAVKQGYEDWLRHKADKEVNHRETCVVRNGVEETVKAMEIHVGDIVKVKANEEIPCDMVVLSTENTEGECLITTANLDGETNLKTFVCVSKTKHQQTASSFCELPTVIECQQPIIDLYTFLGRLQIQTETEWVPLDAKNVLLRGCRLKNTSFIYGCAIYTGADTKISLNSKFKSVKFSRVEKRMNAYLLAFLIVLIVYSGVWTGLKYWWYSRDDHQLHQMWYIGQEDESASFKSVINDYLSFMVLSNYIIPISMYVTIEFMKFGGKLFFQWDIEMYDPITNEPAKANTSDINEELGQVQYLFTDKTGTLTENEMQFRQCSVNGIKYEEDDGTLHLMNDVNGIQKVPLPILTPEVEELFTVLVLCHTIRVDRRDLGSNEEYSATGKDYEYQASSPDEKALVEACARIGIVYHGIKDDKMQVTYNGKMKHFTLHHVLEFDATRKRMSCIVETEEKEFYLLVKGADTAILSQCIGGDKQSVEQHIMDFAVLGLRTLCIAQRKLSPDEFKDFDEKLKTSKSSLEQREEKVSAVCNIIEQDFQLLGATAVEDKLQDGVAETITALRDAGILVWILTGDKQETAVNISHSAGHITPDMKELYITKCYSVEDVGQRLQLFNNTISLVTDTNNEKYALIIDGQSLAYAMEAFTYELQEICEKLSTVLCCRMSPLQKAQIVHLMKTSKSKPTTAAIGDGANDVSMIQEAHVGLGIMGKEGRQAVRCSDYAFGRFRFLQRCLLVHGHYFYWRLATLIQYSFYKNVAMITAQVYFTFYSAFSIVSVYDSFFLTFYNTTFTQLPVMIHGLLGQCCSQLVLYNKPQLYQKIRNNARLTSGQFIKWSILGLWHSLVFYFGTYIVFNANIALAEDGQMFGIYEFGAIIMTVCVIAVNIKLMLETYFWNGIVVFGFALTFVGYPSLLFLYSEVLYKVFASNSTLFGVFQKIWSSGYVWLLMLLLVIASLLPDIAMKSWDNTFSDMYSSKRGKRTKETKTKHITGASNPAFTTDEEVIASYNVGMYVNGKVEVYNGKNKLVKDQNQSDSTISSQDCLCTHL